MKRAFEQFAAWRLALPPRRSTSRRTLLEKEAWQRWDGEGGNTGLEQPRRRHHRAGMRASALTRPLALPIMGDAGKAA